MDKLISKYTRQIAKEFFEYLVVYEGLIGNNWIRGIRTYTIRESGIELTLTKDQLEELIDRFITQKERQQ